MKALLYSYLSVSILEIIPLKMSVKIASKPLLTCTYAINAITGCHICNIALKLVCYMYNFCTKRLIQIGNEDKRQSDYFVRNMSEHHIQMFFKCYSIHFIFSSMHLLAQITHDQLKLVDSLYVVTNKLAIS